MHDFNRIFWHDCRIESVVELPDKDQLIFNVQYPVDWEKNVFEPRCIVFGDYYAQEVKELPFSGSPTILNAEIIGEIVCPLGFGGYFEVKLETNAGERIVVAKSVILESRDVST